MIINMDRLPVLLLFTIVFSLSSFSIHCQTKEYMYVGTYNEKDQPGIFVFSFDRKDGRMTLVQQIGGMVAPSYLEVNHNGTHLYSVNRNSVIAGKKWGSVSAYKINRKDGTLTHLNDQPAFGAESCHISLDSKSRLVFVSNYSTGNLSVFPIREDGSLDGLSGSVQHNGSSLDQSRQKGPHVHQSVVSGDDQYLFVCDLGIDKVKVYSIDYQNKNLIPLSGSDGIVDKGSGPRHFTLDEDQSYGYVINEMASTVTAFRLGDSAQLTPIQTLSTTPSEYDGTNYCADIHIEPGGKFLFGSNRGHNSLAIFQIDRESGTLKEAGHQSTYGEWPRNFLIDPEGEYVFVANQNTDNITFFRLNGNTGQLTKVDFEASVPKPVCLKILEL